MLCAALPCFYVYTQSEESTPYGSATTDSEALNELEGAELVDEIEDPYGIVEGVGELWEGEEFEPEQALNADRTYLKFKKKLDLSPEQCFRCSFLLNWCICVSFGQSCNSVWFFSILRAEERLAIAL